MKSIKARKQRKEYFKAPLHKKRKWMSAHLEENLLLKYDLRNIPLVKGDTVKVMRGSFKGHEDKISHVNVRRRHVEVEGVVMTKADGKKIAKPIHASNLLITKLNLTDKWRREKLEKDLSEDIKKDIEKEAKEQIKLVEEEKRLKEELEEEKEETTTSKAIDEKEEKITPKIEKTEKKIETEIKEKKSATTNKKTNDKKDKIKQEKKKEVKKVNSKQNNNKNIKKNPSKNIKKEDPK